MPLGSAFFCILDTVGDGTSKKLTKVYSAVNELLKDAVNVKVVVVSALGKK